MAKTRAQRKAERRRREQAEQRRRRSDPAATQEERAQEDTQHGVSGEVAEAEAVIETGADVEDYGERVEERDEPGAGDGSPVPGVMPAPVRPERAPEPEAPAPSRADVGRPAAEPEAPAEPRESRRERRAREKEERAQEDTRLGVSGEVAEAEAAIETGARVDDYGERVVEKPGEVPDVEDAGSPVPGVIPEQVRPETEAPAPSRADVGAPPAEPKESRRDRRQREKEERRKARAKELQKGQAEKAEKRRGPVIGFLLSCWAELKRVQWPDRDTLVQASAVTFIFVAVMAAYLGGLDALFNWLIQRII